jgi:regulator of protease activity HflC (stomatin/prohibitin superfamily)
VRTNLFDGSASAWSSGTVLAVPGIHQVRRYSIRDQVYRPVESASATGTAPFQSIEGLSIGVDLAVRWAIDRARIAQMSKDYPDDLTADLVQPAVQGVVYRLFSRYSVREIFSSKRSEIQQQLAAELTPKLAAVGLRLRGVDMGKVDLPPDYRAGMEKLLAEELETEKVRYTLELKAAQVKETQLEAEAAKVRRQKAAEAGFTPHTRRLLIVREAREHGRFRRRFEELRLDDLALVRQAGNPEVLPDFGRWQDVTWRRDTLALR